LAEFIQPAGLTPYRVAKDAGISQPTTNQLVNGRRSISTEIALRLATYFRTSPELWNNLQTTFDLRQADAELLPQIRAEVKPLELANA
jgi:addiction module HigA family antidote